MESNLASLCHLVFTISLWGRFKEKMRGEAIYLMIHLENGKSKTKTQVSDTKACVFNALFLCTFINHLKNSINITKQLFRKVLWWMRLSAGKTAKTWARMCAYKVAQSCPTLCSPMDCSPSASIVHGISRQEYWSGLPCPPPRGLPDPGMEHRSLTSPALAGGFFTTSVTWEALEHKLCQITTKSYNVL